MMKLFGNRVSVSKEEIEDRRMYLIDELGISPGSVRYLEKYAPTLCDLVTVQKRYDHLVRLGFADPCAFINNNPFIIMRSCENVAEKFHLWKDAIAQFDPHVDIYQLLDERLQILSASSRKARVIFLLAKHLARDVNADRLCNIVTLNLEDVLLAYINYTCQNFFDLCVKARKMRKEMKGKPVHFKRGMVMYMRKKLPPDVESAYRESLE
ncbi:MAG: hypothetical protein WC819_01035 [Parcubacteria group bacterium]|jgi:hypothetical protein